MKSKIYVADVTALSDSSLYDRLLEGVTSDRLEKINKAGPPAVKRQLLGAGSLLSYALAQEGIDIHDALIKKGPHGKPFIEGCEIQYNLSHSGRYVLCAIADTDVGCDVEMSEKGRPRESVAERFYHKDENELLRKCSDPYEYEQLFYRLWTLKESFMKITGLGMCLPLNEFCIEFSDPVTVRHSVDAREYFFREYELDGARAACAMAGAVPTSELTMVNFEQMLF